MISLILPYWDRQEAADKAFALLNEQYSCMSELEIIVIDDGNKVPFRVPETNLTVRVVTLPQKDGPKAPTTPWNVGVVAAKGEIIVLSCIEVLHEKPILRELTQAVRDGGPLAYVLAAAWCPEDNIWHCHSTVNPPYNPPGTGHSFCSAMHKDLYFKAGGFDEDYRDGAGYEDCDFINRLLHAGAKFIKRDDLIVIHPKSGATIKWKPELFGVNRLLFDKKWPDGVHQKFVTFVCLKAGDAYGPEYVNILHDMIDRNLPKGFAARLVCITDNPEGLDPHIQIAPLPPDLERWWGKLYMFKRGLFPDGSRLIYFDLDTLITGSLVTLAKYNGRFATLRDFYQNRLGPAVIAWKAGPHASSIWEEWEAEGRPRNEMGDLWWLNNLNQGRFPKEVDILQDLFPGDFKSFKKDCQQNLPAHTKVVCFHGEPRPHNCQEEWVKNTWKIGGWTAIALEAVSNTKRNRIIENVRSSMKRGLPALTPMAKHNGHAVLVGGGPSLKNDLDEIRYRKSEGQTIFGLNGASKFLLDNGIRADHTVIVDARKENARFVYTHHSYLASHCDPSTFDAAPKATIYHVNTDGILEAIGKQSACLISTGSTVGLIALGIAHTEGFRKFHLYGYDSSYEEVDGEMRHHAYEQSLNDADAVVEATVDGRTFKCAPWMIQQVQQFQQLASQLINEDCIITVAGDGLLPHTARAMMKFKEAA